MSYRPYRPSYRPYGRRRPAEPQPPRPRMEIDAKPDDTFNIIGPHRKILVRGLTSRAAAQHWIDENYD